MASPLTADRRARRAAARRRAAGGHRDRRRARRLVPGPLPGGRPRRLRHRPLRDPAARGRRRSTAPTADGRCPAPTEEVVSVAWSPDGGRLAYLVSPGGSICAELHVVRPDGSDHRVIAGEDPRATVFAGGWTGPGHYACSIAPGDGPDADIVLVDAATGEHRTLARGGFLSVTSVSADERFVLARRGPRGYRHIVLIDVATGVQRRVLGARRPGRASPPRTAGSAPTAARCTCAPRCRASSFADRAGLVAVPLSDDGVPGEGRVVLSRAGRRPRRLRAAHRRHRARRVDRRRRHRTAACTPSPTAPCVREIALPEPVMPGWSLAADGATMIAELTGPRAPARAVARPARPATRARRRCRPRRRRPDPAVLVTPVRHDYVAPDGLPLSGWLYTPRGVRGPNRTVVSFHGGPEGQERPGLVAGRAEPRRRRLHRLRAERARLRRLRPRLH